MIWGVFSRANPPGGLQLLLQRQFGGRHFWGSQGWAGWNCARTQEMNKTYPKQENQRNMIFIKSNEQHQQRQQAPDFPNYKFSESLPSLWLLLPAHRSNQGLDHTSFKFTVCGMRACSWEINLEPVCQKKNFPVISRCSSCYKYVQDRSPRFFASSHVKIKGHAFPTSDVPWSCDQTFVESSNRMCFSATFSCEFCSLWFGYSGKGMSTPYIFVFFISSLSTGWNCLWILSLLMSLLGFCAMRSDWIQLMNYIHTPWNCHNSFSVVTAGF